MHDVNQTSTGQLGKSLVGKLALFKLTSSKDLSSEFNLISLLLTNVTSILLEGIFLFSASLPLKHAPLFECTLTGTISPAIDLTMSSCPQTSLPVSK